MAQFQVTGFAVVTGVCQMQLEARRAGGHCSNADSRAMGESEKKLATPLQRRVPAV